jgi:regulator of protease activity HflC (stomatin/prohibitin superfamily)
MILTSFSLSPSPTKWPGPKSSATPYQHPVAMYARLYVLNYYIAVAHETLEGHQREIISTMTVEEIFRDRHTFSAKVFEVSSTDLINMGIMVISYTIHDIKDDVGYLKSLGQFQNNSKNFQNNSKKL